MMLSIVIPVYNERRTLEELFRRIAAVQLPAGMRREMIVIDDGSTDGSRGVMDAHMTDMIVLKHDRNQGKGSAIIDGLKRSTGDIVVIQDADLEYDPQDLHKLLEPILADEADVVYGSRFYSSRARETMYTLHYVGNRMLTLFSNLMTGLRLSDMETCYKMFTRKVVDDMKDKLVSARFDIEPEITARVKHYRVVEVGISYIGRTYHEDKKIGWRDGFAALWSIIHFNIFSKI